MPKWTRRVWPYEEGVQGPQFWKREEQFANQHVRTSIQREIAMSQTLDEIRKILDQPSHTYAHPRAKAVIDAYDVRIMEIYTAHRKAIRAIKDMYPGIK